MPKDNRLPALENAYPSLAALYPGVTPDIQPMGWFEKLIGGNSNLATTEGNRIRYNKDAIQRSGEDPTVLLAHELEHAKQNQGRSWLGGMVERIKQGQLPWEQRPDEIAAVAAQNRPLRRNEDIRLPPSVQALK